MKKNQESGIVHMEAFDENGEDEQNNAASDIVELAKNEIKMDPTSIINRLSKLTTENEASN